MKTVNWLKNQNKPSGDGADFGFWPDMDRLNEELQVNGLPHLDEPEFIDLENEGLIVHISDHGNVTVLDIDHNVIWSAADYPKS